MSLGASLQAQAAGSIFDAPKKQEAPITPSGTPTTATEVVQGQNQMPMLQSNSDKLLQDAQARYASIVSQGGFPVVPNGNYKKGDHGGNVAILNKRLFIEGYLRVEGTQGQYAEIFTTATQDSVARFQHNHGLAVTGKVDAATIAELNVPADKRLATIAANVPRLATYEEGLGDRYIVVNVPAQQLEAVSGGRVFERHNVIVGRPARPTPVVMTALATVKFNPYWNAPVSIVEKDIIPKFDSNFTYLKEHDIKILRGGQNGEVVDPHTIDFKTVKLDDLLFRQEPGPENAMATAKIEFPSPFGIYLHDTPEKQMFNYNNRFYSSGCIRVQKVADLIDWILNGQDGYNPDRIATMAKTLERLDVPLTTPPQLRVAYLTAWPAAGGTVAFRNDVYEMDGSGFTVGQPMPVGEMSPDGKRFVLKPLPHAQSVDAAEAEGNGFFGKSNTLFGSSSKPAQGSLFSSGKQGGQASQGVPLGANGKPKGLFDWETYYKQHPKDGLTADVGKTLKKKKKKDQKTDSTLTAKATDTKAKTTTKTATAKAATDPNAAKAATADAKPVVKKKLKKKLDCTAGEGGKLPDGCKAPDAAAAANPVPVPDAPAPDAAKQP
ncbi:MAG: L,D-transpeptidase family protein [Alphaproteobacteria bacterium]|nr:L,D-transpeptidase family protein [Alphaproteobacteria bacterium]